MLADTLRPAKRSSWRRWCIPSDRISDRQPGSQDYQSPPQAPRWIDGAHKQSPEPYNPTCYTSAWSGPLVSAKSILQRPGLSTPILYDVKATAVKPGKMPPGRWLDVPRTTTGRGRVPRSEMPEDEFDSPIISSAFAHPQLAWPQGIQDRAET